MTKEIKPMTIPVRYFICTSNPDYIENPNDVDTIVEVSEKTFLASTGEIDYERHTIFTNGVSQICLTKYEE